MSSPEIDTSEALTARLAAGGYWPAQAVERLDEGKYSEVILICREHFETSPNLVSGRLAYAVALHLSGQTEAATDGFHHVLSLDPLKHLGDIRHAAGDEVEAMAAYRRILEIDPDCRALKLENRKPRTTTTSTITLSRGGESLPSRAEERLREIPFYTETMGDLYMAQGHPRLAAGIFRRLHQQSDSPRIAEKLTRAESKIKEKES